MNDLLFLAVIGYWRITGHGKMAELLRVLFWIFLIIVVMWFPLKEGILGRYKERRDRSNPLYKNGLFRKASKRKNGYHILSELRGFYYRDIYIIIHIICMLIYGIYSSYTGWVNQKIMLIWVCIIVIPCAIVDEYYVYILKKAKNEDKEWGPFRYCDVGGSRAERFPVNYRNFDEFIQDFRSYCKSKGFIFEKEYELSEGGGCWIFTRTKRMSREIIGVIWFKEMEHKHIDEMDKIFEVFLKNYSGFFPIGYPVNCIYLVCLDAENSMFRHLLNRPLRREGIRFCGINAGLSFESKQIYYSKMSGIWGKRRYKKMRNVLEQFF